MNQIAATQKLQAMSKSLDVPWFLATTPKKCDDDMGRAGCGTRIEKKTCCQLLPYSAAEVGIKTCWKSKQGPEEKMPRFIRNAWSFGNQSRVFVGFMVGLCNMLYNSF